MQHALRLFRWTFNPAVLTRVSGPLMPPGASGAAASASNFAPSLMPGGVAAAAAAAVSGGGGASQAEGGGGGGGHFAVGDLVQICADIERIKVLQVRKSTIAIITQLLMEEILGPPCDILSLVSNNQPIFFVCGEAQTFN